MLYDCGLLQGLARRQSHPVFSRVGRFIRLDRLDRASAWELAVLLNTRGFGLDHHAYAFGWMRRARLEIIPRVLEAFADDVSVVGAARENGNSITIDDGIDYLMAMLATKPAYRGSVPLWTTLALQTWRDQGATVAEIASKLGCRADRIPIWWSEQRFDPLTGHECGKSWI
jgi:hypothetical protein